MQAYDEATKTATVSLRVLRRECKNKDYARRSTVEGSLDTGSIPVYSTLKKGRMFGKKAGKTVCAVLFGFSFLSILHTSFLYTAIIEPSFHAVRTRKSA